MKCDRQSCRSKTPVFTDACSLCRKVYYRCKSCGGEESLARSMRRHAYMMHDVRVSN